MFAPHAAPGRPGSLPSLLSFWALHAWLLLMTSVAAVQMRLRNPSLLRQLHGVAQRQPGQAPASPSPKPSGDSTANATLRQTRSRN